MWDCIIVGAGTAGSVLAHELTKSGKSKILLIEAGGKPGLMSEIPAGMPKLFRSKFDWAFESEPQEALSGRRIFIPRGKMLGGSSNMNAQIHQWGHPADFDGWKAGGLDGWAWDDVAPVFRRLENWRGAAAGQVRGRRGPMRVEPSCPAGPLAADFVSAARAAGLEGPADYNGEPYSGAWMCQVGQQGGRRFGAWHACLKPAMKRPNLNVVSNTSATRILFEGRRAVGVAANGTEHRGAKVVLAAGAFGTPHLLLLSGVGPAEHLRQFGIEPVLDHPEVGANLQDHALAPLIFSVRRHPTLKAAGGIGALLRWLVLKRGPLASNIAEAFAFARVADEAAPDLELVFAPVEWRNQGLEEPEVDAITIGSIVLQPRSTGTVRLKSPDPDAAPAIDFALLSDPQGSDAAILVAGAKLARRIAGTDPLAAELGPELPGTAGARSDEEILAALKKTAQTVYHPTSTCRMGSDERAVLDFRLKLRGVEGLWVADASAMPKVPRGHTNAPTAMIAARAAEWLAEPA
jgi:choline dehydrogenase